MTKVTDPLNQTTHYTYDNRDNLLTLTDAKGNTTTFAYDKNNRLVRETRPMGQQTNYQYDANGRLYRKTDAKGRRIEYAYDNAGRMIQIVQTGTNAKTTTFTYDDMGNIKTYSDGTTSATYTYDDLYRKIAETINYGTFTLTTGYTYNANGTKKTFTYPNNITIEYSYDQNNQLTGINIPETGYITYGQYQWTRPVSITLPGGSQRQFAYDELMRTTAIQTKDPGQNNQMNYNYTYDKMDNIKTKNTEQNNYNYSYDELYRLNEVKKDTATTEAYTYDQVGNRTASITANNWAYNANNELTSYNGTTYQYDQNGNTIQRTINGQTQNFVYDVDNRLIEVRDAANSLIAKYTYDPFGRRIKKTLSSSGGGQGEETTYYLYSDEGLIGEYDQTGSEIKTYGYKPNSTWSTDPVFMKQGSDYYFYQNDHLGTPQKMTNISGAIVWSATYDAFGKATIDANSTITNNLRFPGQYFDAETNFHYNWNRYYEPETGRYVRIDPLRYPFLQRGKVFFIVPIFIALPSNLRPYTYAQNNPIIMIDPEGLFTEQKPGCDGVPNILETRCIRKCCDRHDDCYTENKCSAESWIHPKCEPQGCKDCNKDVVICIAKCFFDQQGPWQRFGGSPVTWPPWGI